MNVLIDEHVVFDNLNKLPGLLSKMGAKTLFLVTGADSYEKSGAQSKLDLLLKNYHYFRYIVKSTNPKINEVLGGIKNIREIEPDVIIAIGGGSVIDTAKLLAVLPVESDDAVKVITSKKLSTARNLNIIAIPTTAGSGSDATHFSVVYHHNTKYSVSSESMLPKYVILDPSLTWSMSPYLTAVTGADSLSQAIESYWAVDATEKSKRYAKEALISILSVFPKVVHSPTNEARKQMLIAAHLSGKAINISKTTAAHATSYTITQLYNIPHGHAVALTLPEYFEYNLSETGVYSSGINVLDIEEIRNELLSVMNKKSLQEAKNKLEEIFRDSGLENRISRLGGTDRRDITKIINGINVDRMSNNPKVINKQILRCVVEKNLVSGQKVMINIAEN